MEVKSNRPEEVKSSMKKRDKNLIAALILIPVICILIMVVGIALDAVKTAVYIIFTLVLIAVISKICMVLVSLYKSHVK